MKIGFIKTSLKENEKRLPLSPDHLSLIDPHIRSDLFFEHKYGADYGMSDGAIEKLGYATIPRKHAFTKCDIVVLPKPTICDLKAMRNNQVLFGWPHCVQQSDITQEAIDKNLTMIAWESMFLWHNNEKLMHIFYRNNEIAGYAAVHHALNIFGMDGNYGAKVSAAVISYGSVSRGAVNALKKRGYSDITVYSRRAPVNIKDRQINVSYKQIVNTKNKQLFVFDDFGNSSPLIENLGQHGIICNGILQNPLDPLLFVNKQNIAQIKHNTLIIDISCDLGMGFFFAKPTSFKNPAFTVERNIRYYAVDHTPSYYYDAATYAISSAVISFIKVLHSGPKNWSNNETISKAIEILNGKIANEAIIKFQNRNESYPYAVINKKQCLS